MKKVNAPFNKYSSFIDTHSSIKPTRTETLYEQVFGKDSSDFEILKDSFLASQNQDSQRKQRGYRLRQDNGASKKLNTVDGTMWTGSVYMGS